MTTSAHSVWPAREPTLSSGWPITGSPFFDPANHAKLKPRQTTNEFCYELEMQRGKSIALAAAGVEALECFVYSSLSDAGKWSNGKYKWVYHFDSKVKVVEYIVKELPELN